MLKKIDILASRLINQKASNIKFISFFLKLITHTSSGKIYPAYTLIIPFIIPNGFSMVKLGIIAFSIQVPAYMLIKNIIKRNRPEKCDGFNQLIKPPDKYSFPSGHCSSATLLTLIISQYVPSITIYSIVWLILIFISRIALGLHYLSDAIFGVFLGIMSFYIAHKLIIMIC
tara:strand:+ start:1042 stop:1557 length:516 start_codon:yes stop_codon:yes gene_type:complete